MDESSAPSSSGSLRPRHRRSGDAVLIGFLAILALVVFTRHMGEGGLRWGDDPSHAMDGVLIHDWIASGPSVWLHPFQFAARQYSYFPTLGIGRPYPPGFAVVEAVYFGLFGVSAAVSRLCVATFGVAAVIGTFLVARRMLAPWGAFFASGALLATPAVTLWTRQTMLEMPTLAVLIWVMHALQRYLETPSRARWIRLVTLAIAAPFFKQTAAFIIPVLGAVLGYHAFRRRVPVRHYVVGAFVVTIPVALLLGITWWSRSGATHLWDVVGNDRSPADWLRWESLSFYVRSLPGQLGWPLFTLAGIGAVAAFKRPGWPTVSVALWFLLFFVMITCIRHQQPRYLFFAFFPAAVWVGFASEQWKRWAPRSAVATAAWCGGWVLLVTAAYASPIPYQPDYGGLVEAYANVVRGRLVFFEGRRDGDFIFAVRERLGPRSAVVVRGSKILYSCAADRQWRFTSYVSTTEQVGERLRTFGFAALFVEQGNVGGIGEVDLLHRFLDETDDYRHVATWTLTSGPANSPGMTRVVDVYLPAAPQERTVRYLDIPIPISSQSVRVDLDAITAELDRRRGEG